MSQAQETRPNPRESGTRVRQAHVHGPGGHAHGHTHLHDHPDPSQSRRLRFALVLTALFFVAEVVGGFVSNSLALLADAGHMFTDVGALALSLFVVWFSRQPAASCGRSTLPVCPGSCD